MTFKIDFIHENGEFCAYIGKGENDSCPFEIRELTESGCLTEVRKYLKANVLWVEV